jgi:hypothetical protein
VPLPHLFIHYFNMQFSNKKDEINAAAKTAITLIMACLLGALYFDRLWLIKVAVLLALLTLISDTLAVYIHRSWMYLAKILGYIVPNVLMGLLFYLVLTPMGILSRIGKNTMGIKRSNESMFKTVNRKYEASILEKMW